MLTVERAFSGRYAPLAYLILTCEAPITRGTRVLRVLCYAFSYEGGLLIDSSPHATEMKTSS